MWGAPAQLLWLKSLSEHKASCLSTEHFLSSIFMKHSGKKKEPRSSELWSSRETQDNFFAVLWPKLKLLQFLLKIYNNAISLQNEHLTVASTFPTLACELKSGSHHNYLHHRTRLALLPLTLSAVFVHKRFISVLTNWTAQFTSWLRHTNTSSRIWQKVRRKVMTKSSCWRGKRKLHPEYARWGCTSELFSICSIQMNSNLLKERIIANIYASCMCI